jgi:Tfp pilus assembly protein PilF
MVATAPILQFTRGLFAHKMDYYAILGVPLTATDDQIKKAYRRIAMCLRSGFVTHAEDAGQAGQIFAQVVGPAREILYKPLDKRDYDTTLELLSRKLIRQEVTLDHLSLAKDEIRILQTSSDLDTCYPHLVETLAEDLYSSLNHLLTYQLNQLSEVNLAYLLLKHGLKVAPQPASYSVAAEDPTIPKPVINVSPRPDPSQAAAQHYQQAQRLIAQKQGSQALQQLQAAIGKDPNNTTYYLERARLYRQFNELDLARADYDQVIHLDGVNAEAMQGLKDILAATVARRIAPAKIAGFQPKTPAKSDPISKHQQAARQHYEEALQLIAKKHYPIATRSLNFAISEDPYNSEYYLMRARLMRKLDQPEMARADYDQVIQLDPSNAEAMQGLRDLLLGNTPARTTMPKQIPVELKPEGDLPYQRALKLIAAEYYKEALQYLGYAIDRSPNYAPYYLERARLQRKLNNLGMARGDYKKVLQLDPTHAEALQSLKETETATSYAQPIPESLRKSSEKTSDNPLTNLLFMEIFPSKNKKAK